MQVLYDSRNLKDKMPFGCLRQEETCRIRISVLRQLRAVSAVFILEDDMSHVLHRFCLDEKVEEEEYDRFIGSFSLLDNGLYYYYFLVKTQDSAFYVFRSETNQPQIGSGGKWQLTCYAKEYQTPRAFQGKIMYQIFPDRFYQSGTCDSKDKLQPFWIHSSKDEVPAFLPDDHGIIQNNDFFGGNLRGITEKLPYLKSLHVSVIYLNPIFMAYSNHRYDTCNYKRVDPLLGTEEDFMILCQQAHEYGMKILLDGVFSHTGDRSIYFDRYDEYGNGAFCHEDSPYRSWYQFDSSDPNGCRSWWGIKTLPCTKELDPGFLDYIVDGKDSVVEYWMRLGADGFRLDVADELPDEFIKRMHCRIKQLNPDAILLGEVWEDASNKISYGIRRKYFVNSELDSVMNYPFKDAIIGFVKGDTSSEDFSEQIMTIVEHYPKPVLDCAMNSLSTHDTIRILSVLGASGFPSDKAQKATFSLGEEQYHTAVKKLKTAVFLQFVLPGSPCIYYGDEVGMEGLEDPFNRRFFPWGKEDRELQDFYRQMAEIKQKFPALQTGDFTVLSQNGGAFLFSRETEKQKLMMIVSMREEYDCFTSYRPVVIEEGKWTADYLSLKQHGFVLLVAE